MDPVTHAFSGLLLKDELRKQNFNNLTAWLAFAGAMLPDIDNVARFFGTRAYLLYHRGITHSLLFALVSCVMVAVMYRQFSDGSGAGRAFVALFAGLLTHIFLDLVTSFGIQLAYPFSRYRYRLDWLFIIDPFFTVLLVTFWIAGRKRKKKIITSGIIVIFAYPMLCGAIKLILDAKNGSNCVCLPELGTPFIWKEICQDDSSYSLGNLSFLSRRSGLPAVKYKRIRKKKLENMVYKCRDLDTFLWFADYPVILREQEASKVKIIGDLRFVSTWKILKNSSVPFAFYLEFGKHGDVTDCGFLTR